MKGLNWHGWPDLPRKSAHRKQMRQIARVWVQVSLPHYRDAAFLKQADCNYRQFLYLHQQNPGNFIVPSFDMDLLWHAHQV